nr:MAG TPA: hypothetical protein [Caudoviricetes sp.]
MANKKSTFGEKRSKKLTKSIIPQIGEVDND